MLCVHKALLDASGVRLFFGGTEKGIDQPLQEAIPLFEMLNVRYVLGSSGVKSEMVPSLSKIAALDLDVYELSKVWPRAFFANQIKSYGSESDFVAMLKAGDNTPFAALAQIDLDQEQALGRWNS